TEGLKEIARYAAHQAERTALVDALERAQWNRAEAARILKVSYKTLLNKIAEGRLKPPAEVTQGRLPVRVFRPWAARSRARAADPQRHRRENVTITSSPRKKGPLACVCSESRSGEGADARYRTRWPRTTRDAPPRFAVVGLVAPGLRDAGGRGAA